jgi:anti-sigma regulatory factor (Ser/Thr protein kinase)
MNTRLPRMLPWGLIALMFGLFIAVFFFNKRHHDALNTSLEGTLALFLENQANAQLFTLATQEREKFVLHGSPDELKADLFIVSPDTIIPAGIKELVDTIPPAQAAAAFEKGLAALPARTALSFFKEAAKGKADTPDDLYRKISAHFNLLEIDPRIQTVCCILTLLEDPNGLLTPSRKDFFMTMLAEQETNLPAIKNRLAELRETADELNRKVSRQKGTYHVRFKDRTLSVSEDGLALLYTPQLTMVPPVELVYTRPQSTYLEIVPGIYAYLPPHVKKEAQAQIRKQYHAGNIILGCMILLGTTLAGGMLASARRQRELDAMRTEFIATVSHELRTPLSLIRLHAETLKHGRVPHEKIADYHQTILTEAERLSGIVNNVLDFSRMERGKLQIHPEPADLSALVHRIADSFGDRLEQEGFLMVRNIKEEIVASVDPLAYSQIVFNLLDNAIKYSDGSKTIRIELDADTDSAILRIVDLGIGIPDKLKKQIFEEFVRSDDSRVTARRGSGIGLSVAKRLAERMNGTIEVTDNEPKGSVFTVKIKALYETAGG